MIHQPRAIDLGPQAGSSLTKQGVTEPAPAPSVLSVPPTWPYEEFAVYLRVLMKNAGIPDYAELSRLSGVSQTQFSNWRHGRVRPSRESLIKIAKALDVPPVKLMIAAAVVDEDDLDLSGEVDMTVLPRPLQRLAELWPRLSEHSKAMVSTLVSVFETELSTPERRPSRRKTG